MEIKAMAIVPYKGLKDMMQEIGEEEQHIHLDVEIGDLYEGVDIAREAEANGYHAIISRGGTSALIRQYVSIPVIEIHVTGYDLIRAVTLVKNYSNDVAVVGFSNITSGASSIADLLDINISIHTMDNEEEIYLKLQEMQNHGTKNVVLGDVITIKYAKQIGLNGILITSGQESIKDSLHTLKNMFMYYKSDQIEKSMLKATLNDDSRGIVMLDENGMILFKNTSLPMDWNIGSHLDSCWSRLWELLKNSLKTCIEKNSFILHKDGQDWSVVFKLKEIDGDKYFLLYVEIFDKGMNVKGIDIISSEEAGTNHNPFNKIMGRSDEITKAVQEAKKLSNMDAPLMLIGERGAGKSTFSYMIHQYSSRNKNPYIIMDCSVINWSQEISDQLFRNIFEVGNDGTVFLKNMHLLTPALQSTMVTLIKKFEQKESSIRFIASITPDLFVGLEKGTFNVDLYNVLSTLSLTIPSLEERKEDIEHLSNLFIASYNLKYGKQIAGIRNAVLKELEEMNWSHIGNIYKLKNIMEELTLLSDGPYIELQEMHKVKEKINVQSKDKRMQNLLKGTLKDIEKRIIETVMEEENMNQTNVAKRLDINRTTLWRKLRS